MMLINLAYKNFFKSIKDYTIYFMTLLLSVVMFYVFNSLEAQKEIFKFETSVQNAIVFMNKFMVTTSVFVAIILGFLIVYANAYFIKRRKKELGIYQVLGMKKREISTIILFETLFVGFFSLVVGVFLGVMASQFMASITASFFEVQLSSFQFVFSWSALFKTMLFFAVIYIVVALFNTVQINRYTLIQLIQSEKQNQKMKIKNTKFAFVLFVIAVSGLLYSYFKVINGDLFKMSVTDELRNHIINGIVMTFLLFYSITGFFLQFFQKVKHVYYRKLNIFTLRQINHKVNTHFFSMSLISLMLFMTIGIFSGGMNMYKMIEKSNTDTYFDVSYVISRVDEESKLPPELLDAQYYNEKYDIPFYMSEVDFDTVSPMIGGNQGGIIAIKQSDFNKISNKEPVQIQKGEYILAQNAKRISDRSQEVKIPEFIPWNQATLKLKQKVSADDRISWMMATSSFLIINDQDVSENMSHGERIVFNFKNFKTQAPVYQKLIESKEIHYGTDTKYATYVSNHQAKMLVSFIALYIGIIFLISSATLLAIQQLVLIQESKSRYELLNKLGVDKKTINRSNFQQICINFLTPLIFGMISAIVGICAVNKTLINYLASGDQFGNMLYAGGFVLILYLGYMMLTYIGSKNILE